MEHSRTGHRHAIGLTRRELLQVGYSGLLGIGLPVALDQTGGGGNSDDEHAEGKIRRPDLLDRRPQPSRHVRPETRSARRNSRRVQDDRHQGARSRLLRASAGVGGPGRQAGGDPVDDAWPAQSRACHAHDVDRHRRLAARIDAHGLAGRLAVLCVGARLRSPASGRGSQRRPPADLLE